MCVGSCLGMGSVNVGHTYRYLAYTGTLTYNGMPVNVWKYGTTLQLIYAAVSVNPVSPYSGNLHFMNTGNSFNRLAVNCVFKLLPPGGQLCIDEHHFFYLYTRLAQNLYIEHACIVYQMIRNFSGNSLGACKRWLRNADGTKTVYSSTYSMVDLWSTVTAKG